MEHTKAYQEFKKNGNTKFVRYSESSIIYRLLRLFPQTGYRW